MAPKIANADRKRTSKHARRGRPYLGDAGHSLALTIKVTPAQRAEWGAAAAERGQSMGRWLREAAERHCRMIGALVVLALALASYASTGCVASSSEPTASDAGVEHADAGPPPYATCGDPPAPPTVDVTYTVDTASMSRADYEEIQAFRDRASAWMGCRTFWDEQ